MKKIIVTSLMATAFIALLLTANVKPQERKQQPVSFTTAAYMPEKEKITTELITLTTTPTNVTTISVTTSTTTIPVTTTTPLPVITVTTSPRNGTIEGDMIWVQGIG